MFVTETTPEQEYQKGYTCGYEWLTRGWNFLHPKAVYQYANGRTIHGYIPGGPSYFTRSEPWHAEYRAEITQVRNLTKAWHNGWVDGINAYVTEHNLQYPILPNER